MSAGAVLGLHCAALRSPAGSSDAWESGECLCNVPVGESWGGLGVRLLAASLWAGMCVCMRAGAPECRAELL